jgi:hypothetical protein
MTVTLTPRSSAQDCQSRSVVKAGLARLRASARQTRSASLRPERWGRTKRPSGQAGIQAAEGTDCDAQGVEGCVHVFGRHALAGGLL